VSRTSGRYALYVAIACPITFFSAALFFIIRNIASPEFPTGLPLGDLQGLIAYTNRKASLLPNAILASELGGLSAGVSFALYIFQKYSVLKKEDRKINHEELGVTGARGMAAFYVFLCHFVLYSGFSPNVITNLFVSGNSGVDFFFVLSAYLLSKKILRGDYKSKVQYYARRIFRIWPTYYVALTLFFVLGFCKFEPLAYVFLSNYSLTTWVGLPVWTHMVEEAFYLILPLWILPFVESRWKLTVIGVLVFEVAFRMITIGTPIAAYYNWTIGARLFDYAIGTVLGIGLNFAGLKAFSNRYASLTIKIAIIASFLILGEITGWSDAWFTPIAYSIVYYLTLCFFSESLFFTNRVSVFLGRISYGWYLYGFAIT
jgi:peptidoglycan/LPS O-acetylase OafA/YrhL